MTRSLVLALAAAAALHAAAPTTAAAQRMPRGAIAEELVTRSHVAADRTQQGRVRLGGLSGRLLWRLDAGADASPLVAALADRAALGGFVSYTPQRSGVSTLHYGAHADVRLPLRLGVVAADRVTPIASLAAGAFRVSRAPDPASEAAAMSDPLCTTGPGGRFCFRSARVMLASGAHPLVAAPRPARRTSTSLAVTPALGVRLPLSAGGLALRADARDVMLFRGGAARHNPELAAGISVRL